MANLFPILTSNGDGGPATSAPITPNAVAVDTAGNLYISDWGNGRIRKVSANGTISTLAGNGSCGYSGDGGPAANAGLCDPKGVAVRFGRECLHRRYGWRSSANGFDQRHDHNHCGRRRAGLLWRWRPCRQRGTQSAAWSRCRHPRPGLLADTLNTCVRMLTPTASTAAPLHLLPAASSLPAPRSLLLRSPGSWIEIYGANLATDSRSWTGADSPA